MIYDSMGKEEKDEEEEEGKLFLGSSTLIANVGQWAK